VTATRTILVAQPSAEFGASLADALRPGGLTVDHVADGQQLAAALPESTAELVVLHLPLAGLRGGEVLATLRQLTRDRGLPVLVLGLDQRPEKLRRALAREGAEVLEREATVEEGRQQVEKTLAPPAPEMEPKRAAPRVVVWLPALVIADADFFDGAILNLSETGIYFQTAAALTEGAAAEVVFTLPGPAVEIQASCTVIWTQPPGGETPAGAGLRFDQLPEEPAAAIRRFVSSLVALNEEIGRHI